MKTRSGKFVVLLFAGVLSVGGIARATDEGISVSGIGTIKARPTEVEIDGLVTGEGELANDASVKFRDSRKKAIATIENLKNPDLSIETGGADIHEAVDPAQQQRIMNGQGGGETAKSRVQISEHVKLTLKNVEKLDPEKMMDGVLKLVDSCRDSGLQIGPPPATNYYEIQQRSQNGTGDSLVIFKIADTTQLQAEAYKKAVADAREKAQRLADLAGIKLGRVLSVNDEGATATPASVTVSMNNNQEHQIVKEAASETFGEIPITVKLQVQFEIAK